MPHSLLTDAARSSLLNDTAGMALDVPHSPTAYDAADGFPSDPSAWLSDGTTDGQPPSVPERVRVSPSRAGCGALPASLALIAWGRKARR